MHSTPPPKHYINTSNEVTKLLETVFAQLLFISVYALSQKRLSGTSQALEAESSYYSLTCQDIRKQSLNVILKSPSGLTWNQVVSAVVKVVAQEVVRSPCSFPCSYIEPPREKPGKPHFMGTLQTMDQTWGEALLPAQTLHS